jgi:hypothetical protein
VCAENVIRIDLVTESLNVSADGDARITDGKSQPDEAHAHKQYTGIKDCAFERIRIARCL